MKDTKFVIVHLVLLLCLFSCAIREGNLNNTIQTESSLSILDQNTDGVLNPYEVLDAVMTLQQSNDEKALTVADISRISKQQKEDAATEIAEIFEEYDQNKDGVLQSEEMTGEMEEFGQLMDANEDGVVTAEEASSFNFEEVLLASEDEVKLQVAQLLEAYGAADLIVLRDVPDAERGSFGEFDADRDGNVSRDELYQFMKANNTPAEFTVKGKTAFMNGVITSALPARVLQLFYEHPEVDTIEMLIVPGSIDDVANLRAAHYVHQRGLTTKLNTHSRVASGGTDFFLSGTKRIVENGASLGVHSWGGGPVPATEVPKDDPVHQKYLDFYKAVDVPAAFYWYTLEAAPASAIHIMTKEEIDLYNIRKGN